MRNISEPLAIGIKEWMVRLQINTIVQLRPHEMHLFNSLTAVQTLFKAHVYAESCPVDFDWSSVCPSFAYNRYTLSNAYDKLTPLPMLNWTSCYTEPLECTRLEVREGLLFLFFAA